MNTFKHFGFIISLCMLVLIGGKENLHAQTENKDYSEITVYRPAKGKMVGTDAVELRIFANDRLIGTLYNDTKLTYKIHSKGDVKIKFHAYMGGQPYGSPAIQNLELKGGEDFHYSITVSPYGGAKSELLKEKDIEKMKKTTFADETKVEEDSSDPIIK